MWSLSAVVGFINKNVTFTGSFLMFLIFSATIQVFIIPKSVILKKKLFVF